MKNKIALLAGLLVVSHTAVADFGLLEGVAKQVAKDAVTTAAPDAVAKAQAAAQAVEQAKALKGAVTNAPEALKQQAVGAAKQKLADTANAVAPGAVQKLEAAKQTLDQANALKSAVTNAPDALKQQAAEAAKAKVQEEATKGLVDLLH